MNQEEIKQLLESEEPIAIIRYFEWTIFSRSNNNPKYILLKINYRINNIEEISVPYKLTSFLVSRLPEFEKVIQEREGSVWERNNFRTKVKKIIPHTKILFLINH